MRAERVSKMPDWPARMGEDLAALYMGVSETTFRERVASGRYPQPVRDGGRILWARRQLDRYVAAQFNLPVDDAGAEGASGNSWDDL